MVPRRRENRTSEAALPLGSGGLAARSLGGGPRSTEECIGSAARSCFRCSPCCVAPSVGAAQQAPIVVAPIAFTQRTLPNGLRVVIAEDHRTPTVAIDVGYDVGGKSDPAGRSGFAHLFEHLMFKGTANVKPESMDRFTEDVGGYNNAYTADDITNYYEIVPSNHLERLLWAEADRMANLTVDQPNFVTERKVVIGEYDQSILSSPYGMLYELANGAFTKHPYSRGVIGNPDQLNAASLSDVIAFHTTFYRPDNAVLVLVGDLDPAQANAWVDKYFGALRKPSAAIPRVTAVEPEQKQQRTHLVRQQERAAARDAHRVSHPRRAKAADTAVLDVIEALLSARPELAAAYGDRRRRARVPGDRERRQPAAGRAVRRVRDRQRRAYDERFAGRARSADRAASRRAGSRRRAGESEDANDRNARAAAADARQRRAGAGARRGGAGRSGRGEPAARAVRAR